MKEITLAFLLILAASDLSLAQFSTPGNIVNSSPQNGWIGLTGDLPGYAVGLYPTLKSSGTIYFSVANKYSGYIAGNADASFGLNDSNANPKVVLNSAGGSFFNGGNVGIGTTSPFSKLNILDNGVSTNTSAQFNGGLIIQSNTGGRSQAVGAQLEFVIPANTDGSNPWAQGRIMTVAGNGSSGDATGKMIFGTRRWQQKPGTSSAAWYYGDDLIIDGAGKIFFSNYGGAAANANAYSLEIGGPAPSPTNGQATLFFHHHGVIAHQLRYNNGNLYLEAAGNEYGTNSTPNFLVGGNVGIGTTSPDAKLTVNGQVHATEVKITLSVPAPDYVFEPTYDLPALEEVKTYIDENKHLPEIPSAKEMETNGVKLGDMNMLLLKKIEELTLYMIEMKSENEKLKAENKDMKTQSEAVQTRLSKLESKITKE